ncbi:MAG: tetratricopeptide repeat protein [Melioribacteraceae bacterium]|nr:tetratricopeptide repeat protein [Melioribacteraceae bacterium]MCF8263669.1 tetratricopeptide repeat protein [Melioribacteraceae bacterium]MCF8431405.1 tetratricopeptide repeat protein [Melioribacteraceae bacterium]
MSEMLGNQYFMARKYLLAESELAACLEEYPHSKSIKRKLIVCYAQNGNLNKALELFSSLINQDIEFIINADPIIDDCPCEEIIDELEKHREHNYSAAEYDLFLGIVWLFCNAKTSLKYLRKAAKTLHNNKFLNSSINCLEEYYNSNAQSV